MSAASLAVFQAEAHTAALAALAGLREMGARVALTAAVMSLVGATHGAAKAPLGRRAPVWWLFVAVPLATPVAALLFVTSAVVTLRLAHGVNLGTSWASIGSICVPRDVLVGMAVGVVHACVLGPVAVLAAPRLDVWRWGLVKKVLVAWLVLVVVTSLVSTVVGTFLGHDETSAAVTPAP